MLRRHDICKRLKKWGMREFGSMVNLARALEISPQSLYYYTSGRALPGNTTQARLRSLGCDVEWLMTGLSKSVNGSSSHSLQAREIGWARFEGSLVASRAGHEQLRRDGVASDAGVPYRHGNFFCMKISGSVAAEMIPAAVSTGDICIFEENHDLHKNDIVAIRTNDGRVFVRVVRRISESWLELDGASRTHAGPTVRVRNTDVVSLGVLRSVVHLDREERRKFGLEPGQDSDMIVNEQRRARTIAARHN